MRIVWLGELTVAAPRRVEKDEESVLGRIRFTVSLEVFVVHKDHLSVSLIHVYVGILDWLSEQGGTKILAVGGLSELGDAAYSEMTQVGAYAKAKGIDRLIATGLADPIADGFGQDAIYVESHDEVSDYLRSVISDADVILVKGSRSAQMDRVIDALVSKQGRY